MPKIASLAALATRNLTTRLAAHGIHTVQDLRLAHVPSLRAQFGVVMEKTQRELNGMACIDLQEVEPDKQQIIASRSFGSMVETVDVLKDAVSVFVANACAKLRAQGSHASVIQVFLMTNRFRQDLPQYSPSLVVPLPQPTNDSLVVNRWADYLVERMFQQVREVCKSHAMTAVLVEQNVAAAMKIADRVIIMNNGQIVFDGGPDEARASNFWHYF